MTTSWAYLFDNNNIYMAHFFEMTQSADYMKYGR